MREDVNGGRERRVKVQPPPFLRFDFSGDNMIGEASSDIDRMDSMIKFMEGLTKGMQTEMFGTPWIQEVEYPDPDGWIGTRFEESELYPPDPLGFSAEFRRRNKIGNGEDFDVRD
jgi:hypothetical protein